MVFYWLLEPTLGRLFDWWNNRNYKPEPHVPKPWTKTEEEYWTSKVIEERENRPGCQHNNCKECTKMQRRKARIAKRELQAMCVVRGWEYEDMFTDEKKEMSKLKKKIKAEQLELKNMREAYQNV